MTLKAPPNTVTMAIKSQQRFQRRHSNHSNEFFIVIFGIREGRNDHFPCVFIIKSAKYCGNLSCEDAMTPWMAHVGFLETGAGMGRCDDADYGI